MRIEVSITKDYCPTWGIWEGIRELVQNWLDQRDRNRDGPEDTIAHGGTTLTLTNWGCSLSPAALGLLGHSDKGENDRGQWGEGLKVGCLALVRAGHGVTIDSGADRWTAVLEESATFGEPVLAFTRVPHSGPGGVHVTVHGVSASQWGEYLARFLELRSGGLRAHPVPGSGQVLLDEEERGRVYYKGILVEEHGDQLAHGYNFTRGLRLDRDRCAVNSFDLKWHTSQMEAALLQDDVVTGAEALERLEAGGTDTTYVCSFLGPDASEKVAEAFVEKYGDNAIPGEDRAGLKGVTVPTPLAEVLRPFRARKVMEAEQAPTGVYQPLSLRPEEQDRLNAVLFALEGAGHTVPFELVSFADPATKSVFRDGKVHVSVSELTSSAAFLRAFVAGMQEDPAEVYSALVAAARGWDD